jgi:hypothetical protein
LNEWQQRNCQERADLEQNDEQQRAREQMHLQQQEALQLQRAERQQQRQQQDEVEDMAEANEKLQQQQQQQQQQQDSLPASPLRAASPSPPHRAPAARSRDDAVAQSAAQRAQLLAGPADAAALRQAISEMRGKVAWLEGQLERALRAREAAEEQMAAAAAERAEERAWHEAQRADRDREVGLLRAKAAALEAAAAAGAGAGSGGGGAARGGGSPGSEALQASVGAEDAALLRAYQQENEAATRRIKVRATAALACADCSAQLGVAPDTLSLCVCVRAYVCVCVLI